MFVPPASANDGCQSAPDGSYWEQAREDTNSRGVRTNPTGNGMRVANTTVNCERVSSLFVVQNGANWVEIGWYEHGPQFLLSECGMTNGPPFVFVAWLNQGTPGCEKLMVVTNPATGLGHDFDARDADVNSVWGFLYDGTVVKTIDVSMSSGEVQVNGERADLHASMFSEFFGLQRMDANATWQNWMQTDTLGQTDNNDPVYEACIQTVTHVSVVQVCQ